MVKKISMKDLTKKWNTRWQFDPLSVPVRVAYPELWVRFHTLPKSKRYPEKPTEYETILHRHNTLLSELKPEGKIIVLTSEWSNADNDSRLMNASVDKGAHLWMTILENADEDETGTRSYRYVYASQKKWHSNVVDNILRAVADDTITGVYLAPEDLRWLYKPYD